MNGRKFGAVTTVALMGLVILPPAAANATSPSLINCGVVTAAAVGNSIVVDGSLSIPGGAQIVDVGWSFITPTQGDYVGLFPQTPTDGPSVFEFDDSMNGLDTPILPAAITITFISYENVGTDSENSYLHECHVAVTPTSRISGSDRFSTSAAVAQEFDSAAAVYVANGRNYPDALSAAPAAAHRNAPLLLTEKDSLPAIIEAEIVRLHPTTIVVVGGTGVVSTAVEVALDAIWPDDEVVRVAGANRYETSRLVSQFEFGLSSGDTGFIATGTNFPDALAASAAAGHYGGPVILVNGAGSSVDQATFDLLQGLGITKVFIAGGTGVVSPAIEASLKGVLGDANVVRLAGADRYGTSLAINLDTFATSTSVYLAVGTGYADALSGAALAGKNNAPLFTVPSNCVPQAVLDAITAFGATDVVLFGGTGALNTNVANLTSCG